jgi:hypothetical protein
MIVHVNFQSVPLLTAETAAVLLAEADPAVSLALIDLVANTLKLRIKGDAVQPITSFLGQILPDKDKTLQAALVTQPKIKTTEPPINTAELPSLDRDVDSGVPTNAIWLMARPSSYQVTYALSYTITGADSLINDALTWVAGAFDSFRPNLSTKTPPVHLTLKRTKYYSLTNTETEDVVSFTSLSFAFDIPSFRMYLDLSSVDREIILTPKDGRPILEMITDAFGEDQDIDMSLLPNSEGSDPFASLFGNAVHLWYVRLRYERVQPVKKRVQFGIGILAFWRLKKDVTLATLLTYDSLSRLFVGRLMFEQDFQTATDLRSPEWDARLSPWPILRAEGLEPKDFNRSLDLWTLVGFDAASQPPIPTKLQNAQVTFERASDETGGSVFAFMADLVRDDDPQAERAGGAPSGFTWDTASLDLIIVSPMENTSPNAPKPVKTYVIDVSMNTST